MPWCLPSNLTETGLSIRPGSGNPGSAVVGHRSWGRTGPGYRNAGRTFVSRPLWLGDGLFRGRTHPCLPNISMGRLSSPIRRDEIDGKHTFGLGELVDFSAHKARQQLFGKGVVDYLTLLALVVLVQLEAFEAGSTGDELMAEFAFVLLLALVHLLMGVLCVVCGRKVSTMRKPVLVEMVQAYPSQTY